MMHEVRYMGDEERYGDWFFVSNDEYSALVPTDGPDDQTAKNIADTIGKVLDIYADAKSRAKETPGAE